MKLYQMDLLWMLVGRYYTNVKMPSDIWGERTVDTRSSAQIKEDLLKGLGGE